VSEPLHDVVGVGITVKMVGTDDMVESGYVELKSVAVLVLLNMHIHHLEV
jgi:hypothetical protein